MASVFMMNLAPEKKNLLQVLSFRLNFACVEISPQQQSCVIGDLLSGSASAKPSGKPFRDEMIIMDGFGNENLDFLLNEMARTGNTVPLKAVTTPTNIHWTVSMLYYKILEENRAMHQKSREAVR